MIATDAFILARVEYDEYANPKHVKTDICDCVSLGYLDVSFGAAAKIFTQNPLCMGDVVHEVMREGPGLCAKLCAELGGI